MKANELRIGNYVYDVNEKVSRVEQIGREDISRHPTLSSKSGFLYTSDILPIPLTEEWLLRFGFVQGFLSDPQEFNVLSAYKNGKFDILKFKDEEVFFYVDHSGNRTCIKSLHQLQNLYFALNADELEIKL